ncbi:MAG: hypothetical protein MPI95_07850 [Nitrosopumilus sp.]|nr:hypothetical protein [Nitrosopumilus sp.]MDA7958977.1 hypothetical protein [Nitrosopumilus sp.]
MAEERGGGPRREGPPGDGRYRGEAAGAELLEDEGFMAEEGGRYREMVEMEDEARKIVSDMVIVLKEWRKRGGGPSMQVIQLVESLPEEKPRRQEAAVRALEDAARMSPAIAGMMERLKSVLARFGEKCGGMSRAALFISRAIGASDARKLGMHSRLGEGDPEIGGGNPTGEKFQFTSMTYNVISALLFNKIVLVFDADAVRAAGIMLVLYSLRGMTDAEVEGIDVPKPIRYMRELEVRLVLGAMLALLKPRAVIMLSGRSRAERDIADGLAARLGVKLIIWDRSKLSRITGVDLK